MDGEHFGIGSGGGRTANGRGRMRIDPFDLFGRRLRGLASGFRLPAFIISLLLLLFLLLLLLLLKKAELIPEDTGSIPEDTGSIPEDTGSIPEGTGSIPGSLLG